MSDEKQIPLREGHQPDTRGHQPANKTGGYQPQGTARPEGSNPPTGESNVTPRPSSQSDKKS